VSKTRREKTLADYVVIAISPMLIMALVGSLAFFLLEVSYKGQYEIRMKWILFCFVCASVLVARIAIEQGKEHASVFGVALGAAAGFAAFRLIDAVVVAWLLLAVIWWCSWKLTWDSTLIDDSEDSSGEGLLQAAGFNAAPPNVWRSASEGRSKAPAEADRNVASPGPGDTSAAGAKKPHAPGMWVVYFSLAALPLFGAGQLFIPKDNLDGRAYGFRLLALYVASALGLLLTTSFLGLRRYLRQRKLQMPLSMTGAWLGMGTGLAAALLLLALVIPRPQGEYTLTALIDEVDSKVREASRFAAIGGDRGEGEGRRIGEQDPKAEKSGADKSEQRPSEQKQKKDDEAQNEKPGDDKQGQKENPDSKNELKADGQGQKSGKGQAQAGEKSKEAAAKPPPAHQKDSAAKPQPEAKAASQNQTPVSSSNWSLARLFAWLAPFVKWLIYGALALGAIYFLARHWSKFIEIIGQLWAELLSLFGRKDSASGASADNAEIAAPELRPFASFDDPYFSGEARRMSPAQLVRYTFEALEAWAREQVVARPPDQTPLEFAQELGRRVPALSKDVTQTAQLYVHVAYARQTPAPESLEVLERLWRRMHLAAGA